MVNPVNKAMDQSNFPPISAMVEPRMVDAIASGSVLKRIAPIQAPTFDLDLICVSTSIR